jgi:hypothetical protein
VPTYPQLPVTVSSVTDVDRDDAYNCPSRHQGNRCGDCRRCWQRETKHVAYHRH